MSLDPRQLLKSLFDAAVASAQPKLCVPANLPEAPRGRTIVIGCGKAAAAMAVAVEDHWLANYGAEKLSGLVVTRYGQSLPTRGHQGFGIVAPGSRCRQCRSGGGNSGGGQGLDRR